MINRAHHWPPTSPDFNPVDFEILGLLDQNLYRGQKLTDLDSLKEAIIGDWNKFLKGVINKYINAFKPTTTHKISETNSSFHTL